MLRHEHFAAREGPMTEIQRLLEANRSHVATHTELRTAAPGRHLAVVTCMDARIDVLAALGLRVGDAHVIRNAGGRVTDDVLRSLALSTAVLGVDTVVVMEHTKCGLAGASDEDLRRTTGRDADFFPIADHGAALREDVERISSTPYLERVRTVGGFLYDVATGEVADVVRWSR